LGGWFHSLNLPSSIAGFSKEEPAAAPHVQKRTGRHVPFDFVKNITEKPVSVSRHLVPGQFVEINIFVIVGR
jgi:hypothetical protein